MWGWFLLCRDVASCAPFISCVTLLSHFFLCHWIGRLAVVALAKAWIDPNLHYLSQANRDNPAFWKQGLLTFLHPPFNPTTTYLIRAMVPLHISFATLTFNHRPSFLTMHGRSLYTISSNFNFTFYAEDYSCNIRLALLQTCLEVWSIWLNPTLTQTQILSNNIKHSKIYFNKF